MAWVVLALWGCECRSGEQVGDRPESEPAGIESPSGQRDATAGAEKPGPDRPDVSHDGLPLVELAELGEDERRVVDKIVRALAGYYPSWDGQPDSREAFYQGWYETPEIARYKATIDRRIASDRAWPVFFDEVKDALGGEFLVLQGSPPGFYVPSFILVVGRKKPRNVTAVFRLSMLLPLYDYYEVVRDEGEPVAIHLAVQDDDTRRIAERVRRAIARHFPEYRELSPRLGSVVIPTMRAENTMLGETTVGELLFCDIRNW